MTNIFAQSSDNYAASRPGYPDALFDWIATKCRARDAAWDCATGNGQAALSLTRFFRQVEATDISAEQVAEGFSAPNLHYSVQPAERTDFPDASFDLVAVAQALHWFDYDLFWPEVCRVARPGALFCAWGYAWFRASEPGQQALLDSVAELVAPYWAENNRTLWRGYQPGEVRFPFQPIRAPELRIEVSWSTGELSAYVRTWSAFKHAGADGMGTELDRIMMQAEQRPGAEARHRLYVPLTLLAGEVD